MSEGDRVVEREIIEAATGAAPSMRTKEWLGLPGCLNLICGGVERGGNIVAMAEERGLSYGEIAAWLVGDPDRKERYEAACVLRDERLKQKILDEVERLSLVDPGRAFDPVTGAMIEPHLLDEETRRALVSIKSREGKYGPEFALRFSDKLKALELMGRELGMFAQKVELEAKTLGELVNASYSIREAEKDGVQPDETGNRGTADRAGAQSGDGDGGDQQSDERTSDGGSGGAAGGADLPAAAEDVEGDDGAADGKAVGGEEEATGGAVETGPPVEDPI